MFYLLRVLLVLFFRKDQMSPEDIEKQAIYVAELTQERNEAQDELQEIEDMVTTNVLGERDSAGKAVYSNETSRAIAIRQTCRDLASWRQAKDKLDAKELLKAMELARLEKYRNQFAQWKIEQRKAIAAMEAVA